MAGWLLRADGAYNEIKSKEGPGEKSVDGFVLCQVVRCCPLRGVGGFKTLAEKFR